MNGHKFFHRPSNLWNIFDLPLNCRVEGFRAKAIIGAILLIIGIQFLLFAALFDMHQEE